MSQTTTTPQTAETFRRLLAPHVPLGIALLAACQDAAAARVAEDAYMIPLVTSFGFVDDETGQPLTHAGDLWRTSDPRVSQCYAAADRAHRAHGHTLPVGHSPALTAEHAVTRAEWALIRATAPLFGLTFDDVNGWIDERREFLRLVVGLCVLQDREARRLERVADLARQVAGAQPQRAIRDHWMASRPADTWTQTIAYREGFAGYYGAEAVDRLRAGDVDAAIALVRKATRHAWPYIYAYAPLTDEEIRRING